MTVHWLNRHPDLCDHQAHWDVHQLTRLLAGLTKPHDPVFVVAGRFHSSSDDVAWVRDHLEYPGVLAVTSDEESLFPWWEFRDPRLKLWVMTPRPAHIKAHGPPDLVLTEGPPPLARYWLQEAGYTPWRDRPWDWFFAGQDTHVRRHEAVKIMGEMVDTEGAPLGFLATSQEFAGGLPQDVYYETLASARVAPAPAGPATPDSFRAFEAFMAGAVPVIDQQCPAYPQSSYWKHVFPSLPTPVGHWLIKDWESFPAYTQQILAADQIAVPDFVAAGAWWSMYERWLRRRVREDTNAPHASPITVVIPTSPIPSHPDPAVLVETVDSIRDRLPDAEILIVADGVRDEQAHLADDYHGYLHHVSWLCNVAWDRTALMVLPFHRHQALALREAMREVDTPLVLVAEHDTPLQGPFNWGRMARILSQGEADVIRFLHESRVLPDYEHLMLGGVETPFGLKMRRTKQWSQRPHLATAAFYRHILSSYFGDDSRTMVEDVMHGVVKNLVDMDELNWFRFRLWVLCEPDENGSIQRSYHLDGRGSEPMFENVFAYDGATPDGAPAPTAGRSD